MRRYSFLLAIACLCGLTGWFGASAQEPSPVLRFDRMLRDTIADLSVPEVSRDSLAVERVFAYKLNRKRVGYPTADDAVTLWNVRRVRVKRRRMRLAEGACREKVLLLKFFTERDRKKGARPHLLGNVAGYTWSSTAYDETLGRSRPVPSHIDTYTLKEEYDSLRRAGIGILSGNLPDALRHPLSYKARYLLDGYPVPGGVFQFIDGLMLRTLEIRTDAQSAARFGSAYGVVLGDTYPDRAPLVVFDGRISTIERWLDMCRADAFRVEAEVPMHYYYIRPVEAVQLYGRRGMYGVICVGVAD